MIHGVSTKKPDDLLASLISKRLLIVGMGACEEGTGGKQRSESVIWSLNY